MTEELENKIRLTWSLGYEGVFDEICDPFLTELEDGLEAVSKSTGMPLSEEVIRSILFYAKSSLIQYSSRTMIYEMNLVQEEYEEFCDRLRDNPEEVLECYPVLRDKMNLKIKCTADYVYELLSRTVTHREEIRNTFGIDIDKLSRIGFGQGDTHNHGRAVSILTFEEDKKLVYKPRNMQPEIAFSYISDWLNDRTKDNKLINPEVVSGEDYGFQEFIEYSECFSEDEVKNYYRRVGKAMAIFHLFDTSDIHGENIIPVGEYPVFTDLETLITVRKVKENSDSLSSKMGEVLEHSVFTTNLLPSVFKNTVLDIDISGLGASKGQKSDKLKCLKLVDKGTTKIHFDEVFFETEELGNVVRLNGEEISYIDYADEIEEGFKEAYNVFLAEKEDLKKIIDRVLRKGRFRQVLRGTFVYERFLTAALHPDYTASEEKTEKLFEMVNKEKSAKGSSEVRQMREHDVPYFAALFNDRNLYDGDGLVEKDFFNETAAEKVERNISELSITDRNRQLGFIRNSIMIASKNITDTDIPVREKILKNCSDRIDVSDIVERLREFAIWNSRKDACSFLDVTIAGERPVIGSISYTLYDGMGLILFLYAYAVYTGQQEDMDFAEAALSGMEEIAPMEKAVLSTGVFSGFGGYIYLYYNLYRFTGDKKYYERYECALERLLAYDQREEKIFDVIGGVSGAIIVCANIYKYEKDENLKDLIIRYSDFLCEKTGGDSVFLTGFSHGYAGFGYALRKAYEVTEDIRYKDQAELLEEREDSFFSEEQSNWKDLRDNRGNCGCFWCHGSPGILMGRSYYMSKQDYYEKYKPAFQKMTENTSETFWDRMGDSLCHGRVGNLEVMNIIAENMEDEILSQEVRNLMIRESKKIRKDGIEYGYPKLKGLMSYMVGLSGIGYGLLRMKAEKLPSVLGLEVTEI